MYIDICPCDIYHQFMYKFNLLIQISDIYIYIRIYISFDVCFLSCVKVHSIFHLLYFRLLLQFVDFSAIYYCTFHATPPHQKKNILITPCCDVSNSCKENKVQLHPLKINIEHNPWRFGSDHFPFFSWVMAVGSSRSSSRVYQTDLLI